MPLFLISLLRSKVTWVAMALMVMGILFGLWRSASAGKTLAQAELEQAQAELEAVTLLYEYTSKILAIRTGERDEAIERNSTLAQRIAASQDPSLDADMPVDLYDGLLEATGGAPGGAQ